MMKTSIYAETANDSEIHEQSKPHTLLMHTIAETMELL